MAVLLVLSYEASPAGGHERSLRRAPVNLVARVASIVDGDTLRVRSRAGNPYVVRLLGADSPATKPPGPRMECGGAQAAAHLKRLSEGRRARIVGDSTQPRRDSRGRLLAYVQVINGKFLNYSQVRAGWARVRSGRKRFGLYGLLAKAQRSARRAHRGVWKVCDGKFHKLQETAGS
jgi:micrococcal nuclease